MKSSTSPPNGLLPSSHARLHSPFSSDGGLHCKKLRLCDQHEISLCHPLPLAFEQNPSAAMALRGDQPPAKRPRHRGEEGGCAADATAAAAVSAAVAVADSLNPAAAAAAARPAGPVAAAVIAAGAPAPPTEEFQPLRIDSHTHILPAEWPDFQARFGYGGFISLDHHTPGWGRLLKSDGTFFREVEADLWAPAERIAYMDATGIDVQVCCTVPVMFSYFAEPAHAAEVARFLNDDLAATCRAHPARLIGLGTLPMQAPALAVAEVRRVAAVPAGTPGRLAGFQIGSHIEARLPGPAFTMTLDDRRLFPVYSALEEAGMALMVHPWDMIGKDLLKKYWLPWLVSMPAETSLAICAFILGGVFAEFPRLRVLFAHAGGSFPATIGRVQHGFECRPDLVAVDCEHDPTSYMVGGRVWAFAMPGGCGEKVFGGKCAAARVVNW